MSLGTAATADAAGSLARRVCRTRASPPERSGAGRRVARLTHADDGQPASQHRPRIRGRFAPSPLDCLPEPQSDSPRDRGGRRRLPLDDEARVDAFLQRIRLGSWRSVAARAVGWSPDSVEGWIKRARGMAGPDRPATVRYVEFAKRVDQAEAEAEVLALAAIVKASHRDWRAAAWVLTHRFGHNWGAGTAGEQARGDARPTEVTSCVYVDSAALDSVASAELNARNADIEDSTLSEAEWRGFEIGPADE